MVGAVLYVRKHRVRTYSTVLTLTTTRQVGTKYIIADLYRRIGRGGGVVVVVRL